jgi:glycosyltransferase involved in cell wall biosynthesis
MESPQVSVIIPTYGRAAFLRDAIDSVVRQTYPYVQIIVVDDASSPPVHLPEGTDALLLRHARNMGPGAARNTGLAHATGELLLFLDDDDLLTPLRLERAVREVGTARMHAAVAEWLYPDGRVERKPGVFQGDLRSTFLFPTYPQIGQVVLRREDVLQFSPSMRVSEDREWWIRMADRAIIRWSDEVGLLIRRHQGERPGVNVALRYATRRQILELHSDKLNRVARAHLRSSVAAAALSAGYPLRAVKWSALSLFDRPTILGLKRLMNGILSRHG